MLSRSIPNQKLTKVAIFTQKKSAKLQATILIILMLRQSLLPLLFSSSFTSSQLPEAVSFMSLCMMRAIIVVVTAECRRQKTRVALTLKLEYQYKVQFECFGDTVLFSVQRTHIATVAA